MLLFLPLENLPQSLLEIVWSFLSLAIVFIPLEFFFAVRKQNFLRKGIGVDIGWFVLNRLFTPALITFMALCAARVLRHVVPLEFIVWMERQPVWFLLPASYLVTDIGYYWGHRLCHQIPFLWRFHAIHHSAEEMDWLVNTRVHPLELVITRFTVVVPLMALGLSRPLGSNTTGLLAAVITVIGELWTFFIHANLKWRFGWIERLLSTPAFHHWHHTNDGREYINKNYASMFPFVDRLFGTYYLPDRLPEKYGIDETVSDNLVDQLVDPFLPARRKRPAPPDDPQPMSAADRPLHRDPEGDPSLSGGPPPRNPI